ncbi:MAG TPA: hypothetical protein VF950_30115 [Planctomycetota bacterium]
MGRAPAFWTPETVTLIRDRFVAVTVATTDSLREDAVGEFCRDAGMDMFKWEVRQYCVTADGRMLEEGGLGIDPRKALERWKVLPEAQRAPGAIRVGDAGPLDPRYAAPQPPANGWILKTYGRPFMRADDGTLRYITGKDLWFDKEGKTKTGANGPEAETVSQAQPDHVWLTEAEGTSLMPVDPRKDDRFPMPAALADRFLRFHLNPLRIYGRYASDALDRKEVRGGELAFTVESVAPGSVRLRLDGFAKFGRTPPADVVQGTVACLDQWGYDARVLGYLEYSPASRVLTRFDVVTLGDYFGRLGLGGGAASRVGLQPIGFAFELIKGDRPADRLAPGRVRTSAGYFDMSR